MNHDDLPEIDELTPCPLCGSTKIHADVYSFRHLGKRSWCAIAKHTCHKWSGVCVTRTAPTEYSAVRQAIEAWNRLGADETKETQ